MEHIYIYTHTSYTCTHTYTHGRHGVGVYEKKAAHRHPPPLSLFLSSLLTLSLSPFSVSLFLRGGSSLFALSHTLSLSFFFLSLSNSSLPPQLFSPPQHLASAFVSALSSSALLFCEKGWLLERKRGPPERERQR